MTTKGPNTQPAQPLPCDCPKSSTGGKRHHPLCQNYPEPPEGWNTRPQATPPSPAPLRKLLTDVRAEMETLRDGETCDHSVGICWCHYHGLIEQIDEYLSAPSPAPRELPKGWMQRNNPQTGAMELKTPDGEVIEGKVVFEIYAALSAPSPAPVPSDDKLPEAEKLWQEIMDKCVSPGADIAEDLAIELIANHLTPAPVTALPAGSVETQLYQIRTWRAEYGCDVERIKNWWNNGKPEKAANLAFTAGPERQMAYLLEAALTQPVPAGKVEENDISKS